MRYFLLAVSVVLSSFVFAQNENVNNVTTGTNVLNDQLNMWLVHNNQINKVVLKFCNNGFAADQLSSSLDVVMRPGQKKDVCVALVNQSNAAVTIVGNLVPWSINPNGNMVCSNAGEFTGDVTSSDFTAFAEPVILWPQEQSIKYFTVSASDIASGKYYTCFTINLNTTQKLSENSPFNLVVRKAGNIKINILGTPYRFQRFDDALSLVKHHTRNIALIGLIACGLLLISVFVPIIRGKHNSSKTPTHKK